MAQCTKAFVERVPGEAPRTSSSSPQVLGNWTEADKECVRSVLFVVDCQLTSHRGHLPIASFG